MSIANEQLKDKMMEKRFTILVVLSLVLLSIFNTPISSQNQPKAWFVNKNATGLNNGTSWTNAWTSLSQINWNAMSDGDTVYISGGTDSLVYNTAGITIERSNVTISKGKSAGHNGRVIFKNTGNIGSNIAIYFELKKNITIDGLEFVDFQKGVSPRSRQSLGVENIFIKNCKMYFTGNIETSYGDIEFFGTDHGGTSDTSFSNRFNNIHIINNEFISPKWCLAQIDIIEATNCWNVYVVGNKFINQNNSPDGHDDWFVSNSTHSYILRNFYYYHSAKARYGQWGNANGIGGGEKAGYNVIAFNIFVGADSVANPAVMGFYSPITLPNSYRRQWERMIIVNNTFFGSQAKIRYGADQNAYIVNNIFYRATTSTGTGKSYIMDNEAFLPIKDSIRYNAFMSFNQYSASPNWVTGISNSSIHPSNYAVGSTNPADWYSPFTSGILKLSEPDPLIDDSYFIPDTTKPYYINGENIQQIIPLRVIDNNLKEVGLSWFQYYWNNATDYFGNSYVNKIGAVQSGNLITYDNDPPEVVSAELVDSVTVNITFSEPMEQSSVVNPTNYSIDNGIIVNSIQLLSTQTVRLNTSIHSPGFYTVTVNNVTDTAGNVVSAQHNSFLYGYNPNPLLELKLVPNSSLASAVSDTPYVPQKTFDGLIYNSGDPTSRWAASGLPQWIVYDLGDAKMLNKTRIQYYNWNQGRIYNYSIQVSTDSVNWTYVKQNVSSTNTEWTEEVFDPTPARYVKIIVHSNNQNNWASLWEAEFYGNLLISGNDDLDERTNIPKEYKLEQNYPNPFNPTTKIRYSIPRSTEYYSVQQKVTLKVFDILGNEIATLVDDYKSAGNYEVDFNASDIASGVYIYRLFAQDLQSKDGENGIYTESKKMLLLR